MSTLTKRTTVYLEQELHQALRLKSAETGHSISEIVNQMIRAEMREDAEDLEAFRNRINEPTMTYEALLTDLKAHGKL